MYASSSTACWDKSHVEDQVPHLTIELAIISVGAVWGLKYPTVFVPPQPSPVDVYMSPSIRPKPVKSLLVIVSHPNMRCRKDDMGRLKEYVRCGLDHRHTVRVSNDLSEVVVDDAGRDHVGARREVHNSKRISRRAMALWSKATTITNSTVNSIGIIRRAIAYASQPSPAPP